MGKDSNRAKINPTELGKERWCVKRAKDLRRLPRSRQGDRCWDLPGFRKAFGKGWELLENHPDQQQPLNRLCEKEKEEVRAVYTAYLGSYERKRR